MPDTPQRSTIVEIPWRTLLKIMAAVGLAWLWLQLIQIVLLVIVAILLAVTLDPVVLWLERRGLGRATSATLVSVAIMMIIGGFLWMTWAELSSQAAYVADHFGEIEQRLWVKLPGWVRDAVGNQTGGDVTSYIGPYALRFAQSLTTAIAVGVLGLILTIYLLIEGRWTAEWMLAFVPHRHRAKTERTLVECQRVIFAYMKGNVITSIIATVATLAALVVLGVPAALLLALIAGLSDFVPVVGFIVSAIPAIVLALTVSDTVTLLVIGFYILYNTVENYLISPWAYGNRMKLSNVAVIIAFAVGAQLAGVIGALIALPIAAIYPTIERLWLRDTLPEETVPEHREIERKAG